MLCCLFLLLCTAYVGYAGEVFSKPLPPRYVNSQFTDLSLSKSTTRDTRSALSPHHDYTVSRKDESFSRNKRQTNYVIEREAGKSNGKLAQHHQKKRILTRRSSSNEVARLARYRQQLLRRKAQLEAQRRQQIKLARAQWRNRRRKTAVVQNLQRRRARLGARLGDKREKRIIKNNFKLNGPAWRSRPTSRPYTTKWWRPKPTFRPYRARKRMPRPTSRPYKAKPTAGPKRRDPSVNSMLMALKQKGKKNLRARSQRKEVAKLDNMLSDTRNKKVIKNTMKMNQLKVTSKKYKAGKKFKKVPLTPTKKQKKPTPPSPFGIKRPSKGRKKGRKNKINFGNLFKGKRNRPQTRPHPIPQTRPHPLPHTRPRPTSKAAQNDSSVNIIIPLLWSFLFYTKTLMY